MDSRLLPYSFARDFSLLARRDTAGKVDLCISAATPLMAISEVSRQLGFLTLLRLEPSELAALIATAYENSGGDAAEVIDAYEADVDLNKLMQDLPAVTDLLDASDDAPVIRMINALLTQALREGASDI
ncbi:MAG: type II secretion system protein GspE, partial [Gallionella sp.]